MDVRRGGCRGGRMGVRRGGHRGMHRGGCGARGRVGVGADIVACIAAGARGRYLSHELLGGEDELVVDEPARPVLKQAAVGVHHHRLVVLHRFVHAAVLTQPRRVVEVAGRDRLNASTQTPRRQLRHRTN